MPIEEKNVSPIKKVKSENYLTKDEKFLEILRGLKIAVILSGGGMKVSYSAGVVSILRDLIEPSLLMGGSGATGIIAYWATGQLDNKFEYDTWTKNLATKELINFWRLANPFRPMFDTDKLIEIMKENRDLNLEYLRKRDLILEMSAMNKRTGKVEYFDKFAPIYDVIQASHGVPLVTPSVTINGDEYGDCFSSSSAYAHIARALDVHMVDKVIVIDCNQFQKKGYNLELGAYRKVFRSNDFIRNICLDNYKVFEAYERFVTKCDDRVLFIKPSQEHPHNEFCVKGEKLWAGFELGQKDARKKTIEILNFLGMNQDPVQKKSA